MRELGQQGRDRGSSPLQLAILAPVILLIFVTALQISLLYHARNIATAAAQQGASAARAYNAAPGNGDVRAQAFLDRVAGNFLSDRDVHTVHEGGQISVSVTATPLSLLPGRWFRFTATSTGPQEVFSTS